MFPLSPARATRSICCLLVGFALFIFGCRPDRPPSTAPATDAPPLRLLVIGDSSLAKVIKREWDARSEGELTVRELSEEEFAKWDQPRLAADAVLFPAAWMGDLAGRDWLEPLPDEAIDSPAYQFREIFAATRKQELTWEEQTYAVPLGGPPLLLFYRRDIFERLNLKPPQSWSEYRQVLESVAADREQIKPFLGSPEAEWSSTCEPMKDQWAAQVFMARAAAYCKHRGQFSALFDYRTMRPLIDGPPFARALQEISEEARFSPPDAAQLSPTEAVERLKQGKCAMAIGWLPSGKDAIADTPSTPAIGVAPLPGSRDVYNFRSTTWEQRGNEEGLHVPFVGFSGRLGALTKECRQSAASIRLLIWLSSPDMSVTISTASSATAPFRDSHLPQINKWTGSGISAELSAANGQAIQQSLGEAHCLSALHIPGHQDYVSSLADAVRATITGKGSVEASLAQVAKKWAEISASRGDESQRLAYMRSIGPRP